MRYITAIVLLSLLISALALSSIFAQAQTQYTLTLWPASSIGTSSGGGFDVTDRTGKVGMSAAPSSGGQYSVDDGIVAPVQPTATPTTSATTPTPATATPTQSVATPTSPNIYLPVVVR